MIHFATKFKNLLKTKKIKQSEIAKKLNVSEVTISRYANGAREPDFEMLECIAGELGVSLTYLIDSTPVDSSLIMEVDHENLEDYKPTQTEPKTKKAMLDDLKEFLDSEDLTDEDRKEIMQKALETMGKKKD